MLGLVTLLFQAGAAFRAAGPAPRSLALHSSLMDPPATTQTPPVVRVASVVEPPAQRRNTYWCVRHGQSTANLVNIISSDPLVGSTTHELTELGREQAREAGADLWRQLAGVDPSKVVMYSSNFTRARETRDLAAFEMQRRAQLEAQSFEAPPLLRVGLLHDLRERDFGALDGLSAGAYDTVWPRDAADPFDGSDGVEPVAAVCERLRAMVDLLEARHSGEHLVLTAHADTIQIFQTWFAGCDVRTFASYRFKNGEVRLCTDSEACLPPPEPMKSQKHSAE